MRTGSIFARAAASHARRAASKAKPSIRRPATISIFGPRPAFFDGTDKTVVTLSGTPQPRVFQTLRRPSCGRRYQIVYFVDTKQNVISEGNARAVSRRRERHPKPQGKRKEEMSLVATGLEKTYGHRKVVKGISVAVAPGEIVGLLGPNGAGKTTTFYMIVGLIQADRGTVVMNGTDISRRWRCSSARARASDIFPRSLPSSASFPSRTTSAPFSSTCPAARAKEKRVDALLEEFGLTRLRKQMAQTLSGGEKRRCEIARALTTNPEILLLDEPFVGIDPITVADIQGILQALKKRGLGILISDHNVQATLDIVDRASIVYDGKILTEGPSDKLLRDPEARRVYLGEKFKI